MRSEQTGALAPILTMLIFSYGTLCEPIVRDRVLGHTVETRDAVLRGHSKVCGWDYLTLIPSDGSVRGVVFEADENDIERMDIWEEVPVYELVQVRVTVGDSEEDAFCYIMPEPPEHYEAVDDSCIASIPLDSIIRDVESMFRRG